MKLYNNGLIIGRFQSFHKGHEFIIRQGLKLCKQVYVYIGSSQESGTKVNPFSYGEREAMLKAVFKKEIATKKLIIKPLPDMGLGNNVQWGLYVLNHVKEDFNVEIDLYITGCEKERSSWFTNEIAPHMDELRLTRRNITICATDCREALLKDEYEKWCNLVPKKLYNFYEELRTIIKEVNE